MGVGVRGMGWRGGPSGVGTPAVFELPDTLTIHHRLYFIGDWSVSLSDMGFVGLSSQFCNHSDQTSGWGVGETLLNTALCLHQAFGILHLLSY